MLRIREKELKLAESVACSACDYMYAPYANYCDICKECTQTTIVCPKCGKVEVFTGEQEKALKCSGCGEVLPEASKILDDKISDDRLKFHKQGDVDEKIIAV